MQVKEQVVFFDKENHLYKDVNGNQLISVSALLAKFKNKFDPDGKITERYAAKHGLTVEQVKTKWKETNTQSCDYGTEVHEELEFYLNNKVIRESQHSHYVEQFSQVPLIGRTYTEKMLYCLKNMVAGTADLIELCKDGILNIYDFKTNKKLEKYSPFGNRMLYDLSHIPDCNFNHYQLQLSIYGYLCELKGLKVNKLEILYLNPVTKKMEHHPCRYMRDEVRYIMEVKDKV